MLAEIQLDLNFSFEAIKNICPTSNEYVDDPMNKYAKEITLDMFGKLLKVYRVKSGDGEHARCENLSDYIELNLNETV